MRLWHCQLLLGLLAVALLAGAHWLLPPAPRVAECRAPADTLDRGLCAELAG